MLLNVEKDMRNHTILMEEIGKTEDIKDSFENVRKWKESMEEIEELKNGNEFFFFAWFVVLLILTLLIGTSLDDKYFVYVLGSSILSFAVLRMICKSRSKNFKEKKEILLEQQKKFVDESLFFEEIISYENYSYGFSVMKMIEFIQSSKENVEVFYLKQSLVDDVKIPDGMEFFKNYLFNSKDNWFQVAIGTDHEDKITSYILFPFSKHHGSLHVTNLKRVVVIEEDVK